MATIETQGTSEEVFESLLSQVGDAAQKNMAGGRERLKPPAGVYACKGKPVFLKNKDVDGETHFMLGLPCEILEGELAGKEYTTFVNSAHPVSLKIGKIIMHKMTDEWEDDVKALARKFYQLWPNHGFNMEITYKEGSDYPNETFSDFIQV